LAGDTCCPEEVFCQVEILQNFKGLGLIDDFVVGVYCKENSLRVDVLEEDGIAKSF
jgi:hypothetical protein